MGERGMGRVGEREGLGGWVRGGCSFISCCSERT